MIRALLTGSRGQVGADLARALEGRVELVAHDHSTLDLADGAAVRARVREARPQLILNAAAYTNVDRAESDEDVARAVNGIAPGILAEEAKAAGALLIHFSTDYVFDGTKAAAYVETDPTNPISAYGRTKLEGEVAIRDSGCEHLILRTSWVYSPRGRNFMLTMLRLAATQPEIRVVDDQRGVPTSSGQLADGVARLLFGKDRGRGLYHATAQGDCTWFEFAQAIFAERARRPGPPFSVPRVVAIPTSAYPTPAKRPANSRLSSEKLARDFGVRLGTWQEGLREAMSGLE